MHSLKIYRAIFHSAPLIVFLSFYIIALAACKNSTALENFVGGRKHEGKSAQGTVPTEAGLNTERPSESSPSVPGYYMYCTERALPPGPNKAAFACGLAQNNLIPIRPSNLQWNLRYSLGDKEFTPSKSDVNEPGPILVTFEISYPTTVTWSEILPHIILEAAFTSAIDGESMVLASSLSQALTVIPRAPKELIDKLDFTGRPFSDSLTGQVQWHTSYDGSTIFRNFLYYRLFPVFPETLSADAEKLISASNEFIEKRETYKNRFSLDYDSSFFEVRVVPYPDENRMAWELITKKPGQTSVRASFDQTPFKPYDYDIVAYTPQQILDGKRLYDGGIGTIPACTSCHKSDDLRLTTVLWLPVRTDAELSDRIRTHESHTFFLGDARAEAVFVYSQGEGALAAYIRSLVTDVGTRWEAFYKSGSN